MIKTPAHILDKKRASYNARILSGLCCRCTKNAVRGRFCVEHEAKHNRASKKQLDRVVNGRGTRKTDVLVVEASQTDLAYAAGVIDGEGCIHLSKMRRSYALVLRVAMTNEAVVTRLCSMFFGKVYPFQPKQEGRLLQYVWRVAGRKAYTVLKAVKPFLTGKSEQCNLALNFYERVSTAERHGYRNNQHSDDTLSFMHEAGLKMKELKKNGGR